jgi:hypothetical protein
MLRDLIEKIAEMPDKVVIEEAAKRLAKKMRFGDIQLVIHDKRLVKVTRRVNENIYREESVGNLIECMGVRP